MRIVSITGKGADASDTTKITSEWVAALKTNGVEWVAFDALNAGWENATQMALDAGLTTLPYQGYYAADFSIPDEAVRRALLIVEIAQKAGIPEKAPLGLDFESVSVPEIDAIQWAEKWAEEISKAGFTPFIYLGEPTTLSASGVKLLRNFAFFWKSCSASTPGDHWDLIQTECGANLEGIAVDWDVAVAGGKAVGLAADEPVAEPVRVATVYVSTSLKETATAMKVPLAVLARYNGIDIGEKPEQVKVPEAYRVKSGDTLIEIGKQFGVTDKQIADWNGISITTPIWIGQILYV